MKPTLSETIHKLIKKDKYIQALIDKKINIAENQSTPCMILTDDLNYKIAYSINKDTYELLNEIDMLIEIRISQLTNLN